MFPRLATRLLTKRTFTTMTITTTDKLTLYTNHGCPCE